MRLIEQLGLAEADEETAVSLVSKCQENEWICDCGIPWQEDPYLEEYPYDFCHAPNMESFARFFEHGNWAIRQGIVYRDLAFVQQVDGGDEWWGLKRDEDGWHDFESANLGGIVSRSRQDFERTIACMVAATTEECVKLGYRLPYSAASKAAEALASHDERNDSITPDDLKSETASAIAANARSFSQSASELSKANTMASRSLLAAVNLERSRMKADTLDSKSHAARESSEALEAMSKDRFQPAYAR